MKRNKRSMTKEKSMKIEGELSSLKHTITSRKFLFFIASFILVFGTFLRMYHFHDFLLFEKDQVRDAILTEQVVNGERSWPVFGPTMRASGEEKTNLFHIGPIYYYFQIFSAMLFGNNAEVMAYPDLFFSILSLPLFFIFLRKYFGVRISLLLTLVYSVSFFSITYSRFAWNPNLIPFFSLLFLLSVYEFLRKQEEVSWWWVIGYAIAFGVGVQLHATTLILFSVILIGTTIFLLYKNRCVWKKILIMFVIALCLNAPQVISELSTSFANTRILFHFSEKSDHSESLSKKTTFSVIADTISCHIEANAYIFFSLGKKDCNYSFVKVWEQSDSGKRFRASVSWIECISISLFSLFGYALFFATFLVEKDKDKKYFLGLLLSFLSFFFLLMIPIVGGSEFKEFRYFLPVFFVPFFFAGFLMRSIRLLKIIVYIVSSILIGIALLGNGNAIIQKAHILFSQKGNDGHSVYYGETEKVVQYIQVLSGNAQKVYVMSEKIYTGNIFHPGSYIAEKNGYEFIRVFSAKEIPSGSPLFFLAENTGVYESVIQEVPVKSVKDFGKMRVYQLAY